MSGLRATTMMDESERALIRLESEVEAMKKTQTEMKLDFVSRKEFDPVRNLVFGAVGLMLISIIGALLALLLHQTK